MHRLSTKMSKDLARHKCLRCKTVRSNLHHIHVSLLSKVVHSVVVLRRNSGALAIYKVLNLSCRTNVRLPTEPRLPDCNHEFGSAQSMVVLLTKCSIPVLLHVDVVWLFLIWIILLSFDTGVTPAWWF